MLGPQIHMEIWVQYLAVMCVHGRACTHTHTLWISLYSFFSHKTDNTYRSFTTKEQILSIYIGKLASWVV